MNDHDEFPDEPPPSYQEATGNPSHTHRPTEEAAATAPPPPPLPPRQPSSKPSSNFQATSIPTFTSTSSTTPTPSASTHPPQTFAQLLPRANTVNRQFPPSINLYRHDAFPGTIQRRFFLGEHQDPPLYAVGVWAGWATQASLVLHNGPSDEYPPLATVAFDPHGRRMNVTLPPLPGETSPQPLAMAAPSLLNTTFSFRVEVPWPGGGAGANNAAAASVQWRKESFEWRRSNSLAVSGLGGSSHGWKLVRLSKELPPGGLAMAGSGPPSGDGYEVVAACTTAVMSLTKLWKFCFLGTGVSGALGERWAVMAVVSGLVTWDRENRR